MKAKIIIVISLTVIALSTYLTGNIKEREKERVALTKAPIVAKELSSKSEEWERYYPRQYSSWKKTKEGDDLHDMLVTLPQLPVLWAGYGFSKDYNAPRGHYYALQDNKNTLRTGAPTDEKTGPMPTACWTCKSPDVPRMIEEDGENEFFTGKWAKYGNEIVNSIGCADCHDNETGKLSVRRPYLDRALKSAGLPTFEESSHQEKRNLACAQCHVEYYFKATEWQDANGVSQTAKVVTLPWANGLSAEAMEEYYDEIKFKDWEHKLSKTPMLKAQHPGYEMYKTGIHGKKNVSCADCHMPYTQEGTVKYSDHQLQSPLNTMDRSCMPCHREQEGVLRSIVEEKRVRKDFLNNITMDNLAKAHLETAKAMEAGASDEELAKIRTHIRHGQWRWDYAIASHGSFFHAPEETLRTLASANEQAQQARIKLVSVLAKHNVMDYIAPDFSSKEKSQQLAGVDLIKLVEEKMNFKQTLEREWLKQAENNGQLNPASMKDVDLESSYFNHKK